VRWLFEVVGGGGGGGHTHTQHSKVMAESFQQHFRRWGSPRGEEDSTVTVWPWTGGGGGWGGGG
jgi:hypothetical protein